MAINRVTPSGQFIAQPAVSDISATTPSLCGKSVSHRLPDA